MCCKPILLENDLQIANVFYFVAEIERRMQFD